MKRPAICWGAVTLSAGLAFGAGDPAAPLQIGHRLELFVDRYLIADLHNATLRLGQPRREEIVLRFNQPWEGPFAGALGVIQDKDVYRMYYRGAATGKDGDYDISTEVTCYAESRDGITWNKPNLGLHAYQGSKANNIILPPGNNLRASANFSAFRDDRPGVPATERYKGVGGTRATGLSRYVSADGIHWRLFSEKPLFLGYALDTLNIAMWSPGEECYVAYIRTWSEGGTPDQPAFRGFRTISRSVSKDFVNWSEPEAVTLRGGPMEHIYTIGAHPYFRAPHILIALPFRYVTGKTVLSRDEIDRLGVHTPPGRLGHGLGGVSDAVLMSTRGGNSFDRTFLESFIRPGLERSAWTARSNIPAFGLCSNGDAEISIYLTVGYTTRDYHIRRCSLRTDGFASVNAPFDGGEMLSKLLVFDGGRLVLNYSTSSIGFLRVEILGADGRVIPGFSREDCEEIVGDDIAQDVRWKSAASLAALAGRPIRLRFVMKDADLYSLQFKP
jgi:hypothetical protein